MKLIFNFFLPIYNNKRSLLIFIFLISFLGSLIFLFFFRYVGPPQHRVPGSDYLFYYEPVANSILQGKGIPVKEDFAIRYPPGYPIILSGIFGLSSLLGINRLGLVVIFNVIMTAVVSCLLFLITESIFSKRIALITSLLWLSYPFNLWFIKNPNTEVPFILLLYLGIWLYIFALKKRHFGFIFLVGIILGFASLIRPISLFLPLLLALLIFLQLKGGPKRIKFWLVIILLMGYLIMILPWEGYVLSETGRLLPLSTGGPPSVAGGLIFALRPGAGGDQATVSSDVMALMERAEAENLTTGAKIFHFFIQEMINRPISFLKLIKLKLIRSWYATSQMWWEGKILAAQILYLLTGLIGIISGIKIFKDKIGDIFFLLSIVFYFWAMTVFGLSILRYMVPVMGFIIIFSAITINTIMVKWAKSHNYET